MVFIGGIDYQNSEFCWLVGSNLSETSFTSYVILDLIQL